MTNDPASFALASLTIVATLVHLQLAWEDTRDVIRDLLRAFRAERQRRRGE